MPEIIVWIMVLVVGGGAVGSIVRDWCRYETVTRKPPEKP